MRPLLSHRATRAHIRENFTDGGAQSEEDGCGEQQRE